MFFLLALVREGFRTLILSIVTKAFVLKKLAEENNLRVGWCIMPQNHINSEEETIMPVHAPSFVSCFRLDAWMPHDSFSLTHDTNALSADGACEGSVFCLEVTHCLTVPEQSDATVAIV